MAAVSAAVLACLFLVWPADFQLSLFHIKNSVSSEIFRVCSGVFHISVAAELLGNAELGFMSIFRSSL